MLYYRHLPPARAERALRGALIRIVVIRRRRRRVIVVLTMLMILITLITLIIMIVIIVVVVIIVMIIIMIILIVMIIIVMMMMMMIRPPSEYVLETHADAHVAKFSAWLADRGGGPFGGFDPEEDNIVSYYIL